MVKRGKHMKTKIKIMIIIICIVFFGVAYKIILRQKFPNYTIDFEGELIIPMSLNSNFQYILYSIVGADLIPKSINNDGTYEHICFPSKYENNLLFVAKNIKENYYTVVEMNSEYTKELIQSEDKLYFPVLLNDELIYIKQSQESDNYYLYRQSMDTGIETRVSNDYVDKYSKPIIIKDNQLMFVSKEGMMKIQDQKGSISDLFIGRYPVWDRKTNKLVFYKSGSLYTYGLYNNKIERLKGNIFVNETPAISPDGDSIAFYHRRTVWNVEFLSILNLNTKKLREIDQYRFPREMGIEWIE
jgi:Tol biopolymer transport system component